MNGLRVIAALCIWSMVTLMVLGLMYAPWAYPIIGAHYRSVVVRIFFAALVGLVVTMHEYDHALKGMSRSNLIGLIVNFGSALLMVLGLASNVRRGVQEGWAWNSYFFAGMIYPAAFAVLTIMTLPKAWVRWRQQEREARELEYARGVESYLEAFHD